MWIEIDSALFSQYENIKDIKFFIAIFSDGGRYDFFCDIDRVRVSQVFNSLDSADKSLLESSYLKSVTENAKARYKISNNEESGLNVIEAKMFFNQSLSIILENSLNDAYFINALIKNFKRRSKKIVRQKSLNHIKYCNAGGRSNIENFIEAELKNFYGLPKEPHKYLRCFVVIDSDRKHKNDDIDVTTKTLCNYLTEKGVNYHILEKREIENYLPDAVIDSLQEDEEYFKSYKKLTAEQKDFFDIEKGFKGKSLQSLPKEIQFFYDSVSSEDYNKLRNGVSNQQKFKSEFPKHFESDKVNQDNLMERCKHQDMPDELEQILDKINQML